MNLRLGEKLKKTLDELEQAKIQRAEDKSRSNTIKIRRERQELENFLSNIRETFVYKINEGRVPLKKIENFNRQSWLKRAVKGDIAGFTPPKYFSYPDNYEIVIVTNDKSLPKTLIIRDSYTNALMPFLSNSFSKSTYIWDSWKFKDNMEIVDSEKPDIVINIILEPFIVNIGK